MGLARSIVSDSDGEILTALVAADNNTTGFIKDTEGWRVLGRSAVIVSHTGNTTETVLATVAIPAGAMGPNGQLRIWMEWSTTSSGNNKTLGARLGGLSGTAFYRRAITTNACVGEVARIANRNSAASQVSHNAASFTLQGSVGSVTTGTVNTAVAQDLVLTAELADAGETISLESYVVEVHYAA